MDRTALDALMTREKLDVIIALSPQTRLWFTGFSSSAGNLYIEPEGATLLIDGRYYEAAQKSIKSARVELLTGATLKAFLATKASTYRRIGVEADYLVVEELRQIERAFPKAKIVEFSAKSLREVKTAAEVALIHKAGLIARAALKEIAPLIVTGATELSIALALEHAMKKRGADAIAFDTIVASGWRGSLPHARPSSKKLQNGELVTIDFGAYYHGYASDITRTFHVGSVSDAKLLEIERVVREAQRRGIAAVKPGVTTGEIDKTCRDYIAEAGYGEYFVHSTGHGLGIDVHEWPVVSSHPSYNKPLQAGNVITVEPGIYIPGVGGVRIEDDVLVTAASHRVL